MTFLSALLLGLLGSAHCALMCGGLQAALQQPQVIRSNTDATRHLLALNLGRLCVYVLAGVCVSYVGVSMIKFVDVAQITRNLRYLTAAVLLLIGFQLLFSNKKPFAFIEMFGSSLWRLASRFLPNPHSSKLGSSFQRGLVWGFLPCGLVYGVLLATLFSSSAVQGALIMLGFGLGTLPAMILSGGLYLKFRQLVRHKSTQLFGAAIFIQGGILMIVAPWLISTEFMNAHPHLMSSVFCLSAT